jgi:hypothetical protein
MAEAIRVAVTSQSTRKRITPKLANELATALVLRAVADDPSKTDQARRYMRHAFGKSVHRSQWKSTNRDVDQLIKDAVREVRQAIADDSVDEPGPSSLELAVRASYPLLVSGRLNADRGSANNAQPDRRNPGEVLDAMRRSIQGVHQLGQALQDFSEERPIRAVDEDGAVKRQDGSGGEQTVNDIYLRTEFPPPGKARSPRPGDTAVDRYHNKLSAFGEALDAVERTFDDIGRVYGDDGRPVVDTRGVDPRACAAWRDLFRRIDEELVIWGRTFKRTFASSSSSRVPQDDAESISEASNPNGDETYDEWESEQEQETLTNG